MGFTAILIQNTIKVLTLKIKVIKSKKKVIHSFINKNA